MSYSTQPEPKAGPVEDEPQADEPQADEPSYDVDDIIREARAEEPAPPVVPEPPPVDDREKELHDRIAVLVNEIIRAVRESVGKQNDLYR